MSKSLILLPLLVCATPALAQAAPQLPPALTDPATAQKLTNAMQALSNVFLNMKLGEVKAALDGRSATPQERNMTMRDMARRDDPDFDHHFHQQMAKVGPTVQRSMTTLNQALPAMMKGLAEAEKSLDRAIANLPDPTYPQR